jgi:hypothetical protein
MVHPDNDLVEGIGGRVQLEPAHRLFVTLLTYSEEDVAAAFLRYLEHLISFDKLEETQNG